MSKAGSLPRQGQVSPKGELVNITSTSGNKKVCAGEDFYKDFLLNASQGDWEIYIDSYPIRGGLFWTIAAMLHRTGGRPRGKGFNRVDYQKLKDSGLHLRIVNQSPAVVRGWCFTMLKYRVQLRKMGVEYPKCLFRGWRV